jgi:hypothetical protein
MWYSGTAAAAAGILTATSSQAQLLASAKPDLGVHRPTPTTRRGSRQEKKVAVRIAVVRAVVEDVRVTVYELADIDVVLGLERTGIRGAFLARGGASRTTRMHSATTARLN